jgi:hypothetical protein
MSIRANTPAGSNTSHTFTVRVNGSPTGLSAALPGDTTPFVASDTDSVAVVEGDIVSLQVAKASTVTGGVLQCFGTVIFQAIV